MVENFNPRPREGSDNKAKEAGLTVNAISIHAPVKGATKDGVTYELVRTISIHAPVKGATLKNSVDLYDFNISIHAPVKGATFQFCDFCTTMLFQSTPP